MVAIALAGRAPLEMTKAVVRSISRAHDCIRALHRRDHSGAVAREQVATCVAFLVRHGGR